LYKKDGSSGQQDQRQKGWSFSFGGVHPSVIQDHYFGAPFSFSHLQEDVRIAMIIQPGQN
jgi:hypothetical protein